MMDPAVFRPVMRPLSDITVRQKSVSRRNLKLDVYQIEI